MALMSKVKFEELMGEVNDVFTSLRTQRTALNNATLALYNAYKFYEDGISPTDDPDLELTMLQGAFDVDGQMQNGVTESELFTMYSSLRNFIVAFETHLARMVDENFTDATIDGYILYRAITANASLVIVDDIWNSLKGQRLQARAVGKNSQVTMFTRTGTGASPSTVWTDTAGTNLYSASYYDPYMASEWANFRGAPLTLTKDVAGTLAITSLKVTGLNEAGLLVEKDYGAVSLVDTTPLALDTSNLFVSVVSATITTTLAVTTVFTFKNVASV